MSRAQCIVYRGNKVLMINQTYTVDDHAFWCLPGGSIEDGESPEKAAIRELQEECCVSGTIIQETSIRTDATGNKTYTFLVDIGTQTACLGSNPERTPDEENLISLKWLALSEIPERDRADVWSAGLVGVGEFAEEVSSWGDEISYPGKS